MAYKNLNKLLLNKLFLKHGGELEGLQITDLAPNIFLFTFATKEEVEVVLDKSLWYVMGYFLSLQNLSLELSHREINYDDVSFWVQIHGLSLETMTS